MELSIAYKDFLSELELLNLTPENVRELIKQSCDKHYESIQGESESLNLLILESELIHINKSVNGGLTPTMWGTKNDEKGNEVESIWPDFRRYNEVEYNYFVYRFKTTQNLMLKTHYGLISFIQGKLNHNDDKLQLVKDLINHSLGCHRTLDEANMKYKNTYFISENLRNAFDISTKSKFVKEINAIINFIEEELKSRKPKDPEYFTFFYLLTDLISNNTKILKEKISIEDFLSKTLADGVELREIGDLSGAKMILKKGLIISTKVGSSTADWCKEIGITAELLGDKEVGRQNFFGSSNYKEAAEFYKKAKESESEQSVLRKYEQARGHIKLDHFTSNLSDSEADHLNKWIDDLVAKKDPGLIMGLWTLKPNISSIEKTKKLTKDEPKDVFLNGITQVLFDKMGNSTELYITDDEKREFRFWEQFGMELQFSTKVAYVVTLKSLEIKAINRSMVVGMLRCSWLNEPITRFYQSDKYTFIPNDLILPGVGNFFHFLEDFAKSNSKVQSQDFVISIDSMVLKIEYILRCACERVGINTTILAESSNKYMVPRAKVLSHLFRNLSDAGYFDEKDIKLFEFLFILPEHENLRNEICHGITDLYEYGPAKGLRILGCITLLAMIRFEKK